MNPELLPPEPTLIDKFCILWKIVNNFFCHIAFISNGTYVITKNDVNGPEN